MDIPKNIKNLGQIAIEFSQQILITYGILIISGLIFPVTYNKEEIDLLKLLMHRFIFQILLPIINIACAALTILCSTGTIPQEETDRIATHFNSLRNNFTRNMALELLKTFILGSLKRIFIGAAAGTLMFFGWLMFLIPLVTFWPQALASEGEHNNLNERLAAMPRSYGIVHGPILEEIVFRVFWRNAYKAMFNVGIACVKGLYNIMSSIFTPNRTNEEPNGETEGEPDVEQTMLQRIMSYENRAISIMSNFKSSLIFTKIHDKPQELGAFGKGFGSGVLADEVGIDADITAHIVNNWWGDIIYNVFQNRMAPT